jgi:ABC-type multidrug transport system permease subunit
MSIFLKNNFKELLQQTNSFYKYRWLALMIWQSWFILWIFIIESSWVLVASLLSFITIVFSIISMKFILNDNPTKKQIILAILVVLLIWIWYYYK